MSGGGGYSLGDTSVKTTLKYGLNPAAIGKKKKKVAAKPLSGPALAAFAGGDQDDDDDDDDGGGDATTHKSRGNMEVLRQQAAAKRDQKVRARNKTPSTTAQGCGMSFELFFLSFFFFSNYFLTTSSTLTNVMVQKKKCVLRVPRVLGPVHRPCSRFLVLRSVGPRGVERLRTTRRRASPHRSTSTSKSTRRGGARGSLLLVALSFFFFLPSQLFFYFFCFLCFVNSTPSNFPMTL